jgi:hypothetical protein
MKLLIFHESLVFVSIIKPIENQYLINSLVTSKIGARGENVTIKKYWKTDVYNNY